MTRILYIALAFILSLLALQTWRLHGAQLDIAQLKLERESARAEVAVSSAVAERVSREAEWSAVSAIFDAGAAYERGIQSAQATADRVAADLRTGALRLRREWATCETGRLAEGSIAQRALGEAEQRRGELVAAVLRVGATCDAQVDALQRAYAGVAAAINGEATR